MIKLKIANQGFIFTALDELPNLIKAKGRVEGEEWKSEENEAAERLKTIVGFGYHHIELPYPLDGAIFGSKRLDDFYSACVIVRAREEKLAFKNMSVALEEAVKEQEKSFFPTTRNGTGYILDSRSRIRISIMDGGEHGELRSIGIGCNGAYGRKLSGQDDFLIDICELEDITNLFLDSCYSPLIKSGKIKEIPDLTVTFAS